jgi:hypothetical protein
VPLPATSTVIQSREATLSARLPQPNPIRKIGVGQPHERGKVRLYTLGDRGGMAAQDRLTLRAGIKEPGVERVKSIRDGQRRHEVAPDITDQPPTLPLSLPLPGLRTGR